MMPEQEKLSEVQHGKSLQSRAGAAVAAVRHHVTGAGGGSLAPEVAQAVLAEI